MQRQFQIPIGYLELPPIVLFFYSVHHIYMLQHKPDGTLPVNKTAGPTPLKLFFLLSSITIVTLGGGYVIVPVIGNSLSKRKWMSEERFYDIFARAQAYPGPMALSTSLLVSIELCGFPGAVAAFFGVVVPPFFAIVFIGSLLSRYGELPFIRRFLEGAGAVVPGIVAAMVWKTARRQKWTLRKTIELVVLSLLLIIFPSMSLPILLGGLLVIYSIECVWKH